MSTSANAKQAKAPGRNDPCPCGSGKKFKKCCGLLSQNGPQPKASSPPADISAAVQFFEAGRLPEAAAICEQTLQTYPEHSQALHLLGLINYQQQAFDSAVKYIGRSVELDPENAWAHNNLGLAYQAQGKLEEAFDEYSRAIELQPDLAGAYNNLGNLYKDANRLKEAEQAYRKALSLDKGDPNIPCNLGWILQLQNKWDDAIKQFKSALAIYPEFVAALNNLGAAYLKKENYDEAIGIYKRALSLQPEDAEILNNIGTVYKEKNERDTAREYIEKALAANPAYAGAYVNLAVLTEAQQDRAGARIYYEKALEIDNQLPLAHANLAGLLFDDNEFDAALNHYDLALTADPHLVAGYTGLAKLMSQQETIEPAERYAKEALARDSKNFAAYIILARVYRSKHKSKEAIEAAEAAINLKPESSVGYIELANLQSFQGSHSDAEKTYQFALERMPESAKILLAWANFEESRNCLTEAEILAHKAQLQSKRENPAISLALAKIFRRQKKYDEAQQEVEKIELDESRKTTFLSNVLFEKSLILDKQGNYNDAIQILAKANNIKAKVKNVSFNREQAHKSKETMASFFSAERIAKLPVARVDKNKPQPIFVVGFPRSGTTLTEQILCSHPNICAGDELVFIQDILDGMSAKLGVKAGFPQCMEELTKVNGQAMTERFRDDYLQRAEALDIFSNGGHRFTDKMPFNVRQLPLISRLFPESPIIHIIRNPADVCVSNFFANFGHGNQYALNICDTAHMFVETSALVDHYRQENEIAPFMNYLEVRYEELVLDQEAQSRKLIEFVGEPWDERCLEFQKTKRLARTASYAQVTEKMYSSSVSRYQRYAPHLDEALKILEPTMKRLGYLDA